MLNTESTLLSYTVNGKNLQSPKGFTILEALLANNIPIPHLCYDPRLSDPNRSCGLCIVKLEKENKIVRSCNILLKEGMDITTTSTELESFRKLRMEQLLADHNADCEPPCKTACPAGIDIQGYLKQVALGNFGAALRIIKEKNPFPVVCGRVCPHPCESQCRRTLTDEPVAINHVKRFVADLDAADEEWMPEKKPDTGKKIAIVGAGPSGLSAAYYAALAGHRVTVFERQAKAGGMMRYGIPDYRLPQETLDKEIARIERAGVAIKLGKSLGTNITLEGLQRDFDAVYMAVGSWEATSMRVDGERLSGVYKGIEYLEQIAKGKAVSLGSHVAVVGGGNTAVDCARTALRCGAEHVSIVYRRTKDEMPAEPAEIEAAIHEGIEMVFLTAPVSIEADASGVVCSVKCEKMELGEPDRSGRRRPVVIEGSEFAIPVTAVIGAIGQKTNTSYLWNDVPVKLNKWGDIDIDGKTLETSVEKVFAGGDCVTGPATVVQAIAAGRRAAEAISQYLESGYVAGFNDDYSCSRGGFEDLPRYEFSKIPKLPRVKQSEIDLNTAVSSFDEVELTITEQQALAEAGRCLECGCTKRHTCQLREEASGLGVTHNRELQWCRNYPKNIDHPFIIRDTNKCISCGRCIAACSEIGGPGVLGFYMKQGKLCVGTKTGEPLKETDCISCGQCVASCPCGALEYKRESGKVFRALNDPEKTVIGFVAPAVRSLICDHYHLQYEEASPFIAGMLKTLGFDRCFDFSFAADLTVLEETYELFERIGQNRLPLFTSCCPGWVNFVEKRYPKLIPHLSSCKSPQQMMGATVKNHLPIWLSETAGSERKIGKEDLFVVSIVPCLAKKTEAARDEFQADGIRDVDAVLTSTELIEMIENRRITASAIAPMEFDSPYSRVSGAGILFGASGGVAEAALRMAVSKAGQNEIKEILEFEDIRGLEGVKTTQVELNGKTVRIAVVSGLKYAEPLVRQVIDKGVSEFDMIEVMACPGGCIAGAGHPVPETKGVLKERHNVLLAIDEKSKVRRSGQNDDLLKLYDEFFGEIHSDISKRLLHTRYTSRKKEGMLESNRFDESAWQMRTIQVCIDQKCTEKGSYQLLTRIKQTISDLQLDRFFEVKPGLYTGHSYPDEIFVAVDGQRVPKEELDNIEDWLMSSLQE